MEERKRRYRRLLWFLLAMNLCSIVLMSYHKIEESIPDKLRLFVSEESNFHLSFPLKGEINSGDQSVISINRKKLEKSQIHLSSDFSVLSKKKGDYSVGIKLFGLIPMKDVEVSVIDSLKITPSGIPIGIYLEMDGILVLGTSPILSEDGEKEEPAAGKLKTGDYIHKVNGVEISNKDQLMKEISNCSGNPISFSVRRDGKNNEVVLNPVLTPEGEYKIGTWIRDNTQGIGTLTYAASNGNFGALGHGISDIDTSLLIDSKKGTLYHANILSITKGKSGTPGELVGEIEKNEEQQIGSILKNTEQGIFGKLNHNFESDTQPLTVGLKQEVELGEASIMCQIDGKTKEYKIEIEKIRRNDRYSNKGMVIKIIDEELLKRTNGIVQGMSGSPIIQNNKLIGAVTHVFIQDSTKGYGTFIENMLSLSE